jgi:hypothetical protein
MRMNFPARCDAAAHERHQTLDFIGLRSHATAVGLIQLCEELLKSGVLSVEGLDRIKDAICSELAVGKRAWVSEQREFDTMLRRRIDAVFPKICETTDYQFQDAAQHEAAGA